MNLIAWGACMHDLFNVSKKRKYKQLNNFQNKSGVEKCARYLYMYTETILNTLSSVCKLISSFNNMQTIVWALRYNNHGCRVPCNQHIRRKPETESSRTEKFKSRSVDRRCQIGIIKIALSTPTKWRHTDR